MGINGGYFPAIFGVCLLFLSHFVFLGFFKTVVCVLRTCFLSDNLDDVLVLKYFDTIGFLKEGE